MVETIVLAHLASTWFMVGLIWMVQRVHYPLMHYVPPSSACLFENDHCSRIGAIVGPVMAIEAMTALALTIHFPSGTLWILSLVLLALIWGSTALIQMPLHQKLSESLEADLRRKTVSALVSSNWIRTVAWTLRGIIVLQIFGKQLSPLS